MDLRIKRQFKLSVLPKPGDGLRALVDHAPQAEAFAERTAEQMRPAMLWFYGNRRRLGTVVVSGLAVWLFLHVTFGANGMMVYQQKRNELREMRSDVDALEKQNQQYLQQINSLKTDPKAIEREAREQLHYAKPGEVVYVSPVAPPVSQAPTSKTARKR